MAADPDVSSEDYIVKRFVISSLCALCCDPRVSNGISFRTSREGADGYPAPAYLQGLLKELKAIGVGEADLIGLL